MPGPTQPPRDFAICNLQSAIQMLNLSLLTVALSHDLCQKLKLKRVNIITLVFQTLTVNALTEQSNMKTPKQ